MSIIDNQREFYPLLSSHDISYIKNDMLLCSYKCIKSGIMNANNNNNNNATDDNYKVTK